MSDCAIRWRKAYENFEIVAEWELDKYIVKGSSDPTRLATMCMPYCVLFKLRYKNILTRELDERLRDHEEA